MASHSGSDDSGNEVSNDPLLYDSDELYIYDSDELYIYDSDELPSYDPEDPSVYDPEDPSVYDSSEVDDEFNDSDEEEEPDIYPTCGLCRFYFVPGEIVGTSDLVDTRAQYWPGTYVNRAELERHHVRAFHLNCIYVVNDNFEVWEDLDATRDGLEGVYNVTGGTFDFIEPPQSMTERRDRWLQDSMVQDLQSALQNRLPREIYENIASYCKRERAARIAQDTWVNRGYPTVRQQYFFDGENDLWVNHVEIEGFRYVRSLNNRSISPSDTLIYSADTDTDTDTDAHKPLSIYFAEDYRGIRQVVISKSFRPPSVHREAGLHWVICCRGQRLPFYLHSRSDAVKLRGVAITPDGDDPKPDWNLRRWATFPRDLDPFLQLPAIDDDYNRNLNYYEAVQAVDWNSPGVCGYYFFLPRGDLRGIVAVKLQDLPTAHIDEYGEHCLSGLYVPIESDERVSELWLRTGDYFRYSDWECEQKETLILRTSKGRCHVLGPDKANAWLQADKTELKEFTYRTVATFSETGQKRMYYSRAGHDDIWLGFQKSTALDVWGGLGQVSAWTGAITAWFPAPKYDSRPLEDGYISTSAPVDGVKSIRACWAQERWTQGGRYTEKFIVGLLLGYADGSQRCVGKVRPDCLEAPMEIRADKIWLGASHRNSRWCRGTPWFPGDLSIDCIRVEEPFESDRVGYDYLEVPLAGRLEWHFYRQVCAVGHFDGNESHDEIGAALARATKNTLCKSDVKNFTVKVRSDADEVVSIGN
ncbi:hypothetical protein FLONG3_9564 [Fusarium longipes]|uniref:Uncharacterized protein n=1 Tax=Fusarium longipes TaxID=694270 RepID=A0A395RWH3_9HYPO|nr:hypothetical protein FLONG3_9564 [Fusarium longipes]